jgi:hypothetical protein
LKQISKRSNVFFLDIFEILVFLVVVDDAVHALVDERVVFFVHLV